jgi:monothiol glutaredoxin
MYTKEKIAEIVKARPVVLFAKGSRFEPMCGFSARAIDVLERIGADFEVVNIFDDDTLRPALVAYSGWPTTPQLFIDGELIGGSDIMLELFESGELQKKLAAT